MSEEFGKYILQRKLAEGGMAEVFLAKQSGMEGFEKPVVIKRILPHLSGEQQFIDMFLNEARVAARLSHPSIVQIFDFGKIDDQYFIAMEYIHGEDLRNLAKAADKAHKRPSMALISRVMADTLGALHYAHTRSGADGRKLGLVHRDISPQNVLVTFEGGVKLVDFGIAKATQSQSGQQTQAGLLKGKYAYMSPEQCRGQQLDARSDVFAVGILLWELLTWKRLFRRDTDLTTLVAVVDEPVPPLSSVRGDVPPELDQITARALQRNLDDRYPSAQAMQADLEALIRKYGWEADSIRLQLYMREAFADKLRLQDEAIRSAGLGSIEDFLVRVDEGTQMAWVDTSAPGGPTPSGFSLPSVRNSGTSQPRLPTPPDGGGVPARPIQMTPSQPQRVVIHPTPRTTGASAVVAQPMAAQASGPWSDSRGPEFTGSTLQHAVGQSVARDPSRSAIVLPQPAASPWKRLAVVIGTSVLAGAGVMAAVFWPTGDGATVTTGTGGESPVVVEEVAKVRVLLDRPATVLVDGVAQPAAKETVVQVKAHSSHELQLQVDGKAIGPALVIPPLEPGEVKTIRKRLGGD